MNDALKRLPRPQSVENAWRDFVPEVSLISYGRVSVNISIDPNAQRPPEVASLVARHGKAMHADGIKDGTGFLGVTNYALNGRSIDLLCRPVTYFEHRVTDLCFIKKPYDEEHARWIYAQSRKADQNGFIPTFANLLGMDVLLLCRGDHGGMKSVFQVRSNNVVARHGMLMGSASGGLTTSDSSNLSAKSLASVAELQRVSEPATNRKSDANIYHTCASELQEEIGVKAEQLTSLSLRGFIHDIPESDPDALFVATTNLTESDIIKASAKSMDNYEFSKLFITDFPVNPAALAEMKGRMSPQAKSVYLLALMQWFGDERGVSLLRR